MRIVVLVMLMSGMLCAEAQTVWNLKIDKNDIKVYNAASESSKFSKIKVEVSYPACSLSDLVSAVLDVGNHKRWSYGTRLAYPLKKLSDSEIYFYKEINSPPTVSNRDLVGDMKIMQDPVTKVLNITVKSVAGYLPDKQGVVRVPMTDENWIITKLPDHKIKIEYYLSVDIGGSVSPFLFNMFATKGPYETFKSLKDELVLRSKTPSHYAFVED